MMVGTWVGGPSTISLKSTPKSTQTQILSAGLMLYTQDKAKINIKTRPVSKDGYLHI